MSSMIDPTTGQDLSQNRQHELREVTIIMIVLAAAFVALRFIARWKAGVYWGVDDYLAVLSLFVLCMLMLIMLLMINSGLGIHAAALSYATIVDTLKGLLAFECIYVTTVATIKIALLFMYKRAFDIKSLRIQAYILGAITLSWAVAIILVCIFQCSPVSKAWNPALPGECLDLKGSFIGNAVPNIVTDVLILALPIRYVWKMVPDRTLRWQLTVVFLLGSFVVFVSIYRFITLFRFIPSDTTWTLAEGCLWCIVECSVGIISICLPTLGPLLTWMSCIPAARAGSRTKNHSNGSQQLSSGRDKFSEFSQTAYGDVLRSTSPPIGGIDRPSSKAFDQERRYDAYEMNGRPVSTENIEVVELTDNPRGERDDESIWAETPPLHGLKPREMSSSYKHGSYM